MNKQALVKWINDNIDSHGIYKASLLSSLSEFGINYNVKSGELIFENKIVVKTYQYEKQQVIDGLDILKYICYVLDIDIHTNYIGRGKQFYELVDRLSNS